VTRFPSLAPLGLSVLFAAASALALPASPRSEPCGAARRPAAGDAPPGLRAVVVQREEEIPDALSHLRALAGNTLVTYAPPDAFTGEAARARGLDYLAWMTTAEIERAASDPAAADELRRLPGLTGVYYEDDAAVEGYTSPDDQRLAYERLKGMRPGLLVLHPLRLDPIAWDPGYLDRVFRPEFTDMVVPYFYPVGSTVLGSFQEDDPWEATLGALLAEVERRTRSSGTPVLPVLQGFEQDGYPVGEEFLARQARVYRSVWPDVSSEFSAAIFEWGHSAVDEPFAGLGLRPRLAAGARSLFRSMAVAARRLDRCPPAGPSRPIP